MPTTVFHVSRDTEDLARALNSSKNLLAVLPDAYVHIIINGSAITGLPLLDTPPATAENVRISACAVGLKAHKIEPSSLPEGIGVVDSAVAELSREQWAGAAYIAF